MADAARLSVISYALLGQLSLRPWSVYEMTKNVGRTLHWFWPSAESALYGETKRLASLGLARARTEAGRRGRPATIYTITPKGRRALARWLEGDPGGFTFHFEPLLRVHLAPYGTKDDLLRALEAAQAEAESLLRQALTIGAEFAEGRHQFQEQVHIRAILFDYLWTFGLTMHAWAERSIARVDAWDDLSPTPALLAEGADLIRAAMDAAPVTART
jgi:PadR family transcriptional regulator, regulatory protein AphA